MTVLALTAGLPGILGVLLHRLLDGLLVGHLGCAHVGLHLVLPEQTVHDDLQVELAHAGDDGLAGLLVGVGLEGGVLLGQLHEGHAHLFLAGLGLGLDGHPDDGLGELHGLQNDGGLVVAQGVAGGGVLQTHHGGDVAGVDGLNVLPVVGVHLQNPADALSLPLGGVEHGGAGVQHAGVHADEGQTAHIGVGGNLKGQGGEGGLVVGGTLVLVAGVGVHALDGGDVQGGGHVVHDGVQELLDPLVPVGGAAGHGDQQVLNGALAQGGPDHVRGDGLILQGQHHELLVQVGAGVDELGPVLLGQVHHVLGDLLHPHVLALGVVIDVGLHFHQVNDALEGLLAADGQLDGHRVALEAVMNHVQNVVEVRAHDVHLVDVDHAGDLIVVGLAPHCLRLGLHAALGAHDGDRTVQHPQGTLHLHGEVHVARGVNDVDPGLGELAGGAGPVAGGGGGGDGDAPLLFLGHPVHGGGAVMGLTDLIVDAGVIQDSLGGGGFSGVDVGHDADVSGVFQSNFTCHSSFSSRLPAEVCECLVGLGHLMDLFPLLHGAAKVVGGVHQLCGQTLLHGPFAALAGIGGQPAQAEGLAALRAHFHGHLIGGAAHTAGLDLQGRHDVLHGGGEDLQGILAGLLLDNVKGAVNHFLCHAFLAVEHNAVDQLSYQYGTVHRIGQHFPLGYVSSSGHFASLLHKKMIS